MIRGGNNARRRRKIWRYIRGETAKKTFFAPAASYTFFSFTLVYRVLVAMHKTHFDLFWPAAAKKIGFKYNKNSWKVGELTRISGDFFRKKVNSPGLSETGNLNSPPKLIPL